jgi:hypothetical protein
MRKVMRRKFKALTEGKILNDEDFDDLLNAHDESENEDGAEDEDEMSDVGSESKDEQIISRVRTSDLIHIILICKKYIKIHSRRSLM